VSTNPGAGLPQSARREHEGNSRRIIAGRIQDGAVQIETFEVRGDGTKVFMPVMLSARDAIAVGRYILAQGELLERQDRAEQALRHAELRARLDKQAAEQGQGEAGGFVGPGLNELAAKIDRHLANRARAELARRARKKAKRKNRRK
jgi:hypothetical protein